MRHPVLANGLYHGLEIGKTQRFYDVAVCATAIASCDVASCFAIREDDDGRERQRIFRFERPYLPEYGETVRPR